MPPVFAAAQRGPAAQCGPAALGRGRAGKASRLGVLAAVLLVALLAGCELPTGPGTPPAAVDHVDDVLLSIPPSPVVDEDPTHPGPETVLVSVQFYRRSDPRPLAVKGTLQIQMFDGRQAAGVPLLQTWKIGPADLQRLLRPTRFGLYEYPLALRWNAPPPSTGSITLVATYLPPQGPPVYSTPVSAAVGPT